ncbi:MAG: hypothetical protein D6694_13435, partial [Gammaproteobacteria bacterium]
VQVSAARASYQEVPKGRDLARNFHAKPLDITPHGKLSTSSGAISTIVVLPFTPQRRIAMRKLLAVLLCVSLLLGGGSPILAQSEPTGNDGDTPVHRVFLPSVVRGDESESIVAASLTAVAYGNWLDYTTYWGQGVGVPIVVNHKTNVSVQYYYAGGTRQVYWQNFGGFINIAQSLCGYHDWIKGDTYYQSSTGNMSPYFRTNRGDF